MKFDHQKAFPYPVLRPFSDDYQTSEFQAAVEVNIGSRKGKIAVNINFMTSATTITEQVRLNNAVYTAVIACRETYFRDVLHTYDGELRKEYSAGQFKGEVEVQPYITAKHEITDYMSDDIAPEFGTGPFTYRKGQVLAMDEPQIFYVDRDVFRPITSVFELVMDKNNVHAEWTIRLEENHVQIALSPTMKEVIDSARNSTANKAILVNSLYFSAVVHAIQSVKESTDYDHFRWAQVLHQQCHNAGISVASHPSYYIAESLMQKPLALLQRYVFEGAV